MALQQLDLAGCGVHGAPVRQAAGQQQQATPNVVMAKCPTVSIRELCKSVTLYACPVIFLFLHLTHESQIYIQLICTL